MWSDERPESDVITDTRRRRYAECHSKTSMIMMTITLMMSRRVSSSSHAAVTEASLSRHRLAYNNHFNENINLQRAPYLRGAHTIWQWHLHISKAVTVSNHSLSFFAVYCCGSSHQQSYSIQWWHLSLNQHLTCAGELCMRRSYCLRNRQIGTRHWHIVNVVRYREGLMTIAYSVWVKILLNDVGNYDDYNQGL